MTGNAPDLLWTNFFEFSYNNYSERLSPAQKARYGHSYLDHSPKLRWDQNLWVDLTHQMARAGGNSVMLHLGDGIRWRSHPEIAVEDAWSIDDLQAERQRLAGLGLTLIPMLNFSSAHDLWLGTYHRMVSTPEYYRVCEDLIQEAIELFDYPPYFSLGYDEEQWWHQTWYDYAVLRQRDLWWEDFLWFVDQVVRRGSRPWIWSDKIWDHVDEFLARMPKSVIQSNWYYLPNFDLGKDLKRAAERNWTIEEPAPGRERTKTTELRAFLEMERGGYDQVPAGSIDVAAGNFQGNVRFAHEHLAPERTLGFMQTYWRPLLPEFREFFEAGIRDFGEGRAWWTSRSPDPASQAGNRSA
jgi:hypothetical protein